MGGRLTYSLVAALALTGCSGVASGPSLLPPRDAADRVEQALDVHLRPAADPDVPTLANLVSTYVGSDGDQAVDLLVFNTAASTAQVTGVPAAELPAGATIVSRRNVIVIYHGPKAADQRAEIQAALAH